MIRRDNLFTYLLISIFFHFIFIHFVFRTREKPIFEHIPVEISFYSKIQDVVDGQSEVLNSKEKSRYLDTRYKNKIEIVNSHHQKKSVNVKKEKKFQELKSKRENYSNNHNNYSDGSNIKTSEDNNVKNSQYLSSTNTISKGVSQYGTLSFDTLDFKYSYYAEEIVKKISRQWKWTKNYGQLRVIIYFKIRRDGSTFDISIKESSGDKEYDKYALDTIYRTAPFPDLPDGYRNDTLGVYFEFQCKD